jgi:hypothetical protein
MNFNLNEWLGGLGLEKHVAIFQDNEIDLDTLLDLTDEDLKEIGVNALGSRKKVTIQRKKIEKTKKRLDKGFCQIFDFSFAPRGLSCKSKQET